MPRSRKKERKREKKRDFFIWYLLLLLLLQALARTAIRKKKEEKIKMGSSGKVSCLTDICSYERNLGKTSEWCKNRVESSTSFFSLVRAYSDMACGACGTELRYIKGTQDGAGRISYTFYFCDRCDIEWRLRRRKE